MVAANVHLRAFTDDRHDFVWARSISHHVAQVPQRIELARSGQHSVQRFKVSVNVRKD
jgi:hypothetical protein